MSTASEIRNACVCQALRSAARRISRRYEEALRPVGLTAGQFSVLAALLREDPVPLGALAGSLGMDRSTLTRDLQPLERRDLVASAAGPDDRRVRFLRLTTAGRRLMRRALPLWQAAQRDARARFDPDSWPELRAWLDAVA